MGRIELSQGMAVIKLPGRTLAMGDRTSAVYYLTCAEPTALSFTSIVMS